MRGWGRNLDGQLGDETTDQRTTPVSAPSLADVVEVSAGSDHGCARSSDGSLQCWGQGTNGQLGNSAMEDSLVPVPVTGITDAIRVDAGTRSACSVLW